MESSCSGAKEISFLFLIFFIRQVIHAHLEKLQNKNNFLKNGRKDSPIIIPPRSSTVNVLVYSPKNKGNDFEVH